MGTSATLDLIPGVLILKDLSIGIDMLGGSADFTASGTAELNTGSNGPLVLQVSGTASTFRDVRLNVRTTEPLRPLPDLLPDLLVLLMGIFTAGTDKSISVEVTGTAVSSILLFDLLGDVSPKFGVHLSHPNGTGTSTLTASFDASELNLVTGALLVGDLSAIIDLANGSIDFTASDKAEFIISAKSLVLQVAGTASNSGYINLDVSTSGSYVPLPELLPYFIMSCLTGELTAGADNGSKPMILTAEAVSFSLTNVLQFDIWTGNLC